MLFESSISAYWIGEYQEAESACERLLAMPDLPDLYRAQTLSNLQAVRAAGVCWGESSHGPRPR
jgi:hypothetical protein